MDLQPKIIELLNNRGITSQEEIDEFLSDKPQKTYDPFLLHNMEAGVDLILSTIENGGSICIYGDYDADGITSTAILMEVLSKLTESVGYYIPSRFEEGYGLNCRALEKIKEMGYDLVVTVDCGSVSCEEVAYARKIGLKIMVTDHHTIGDKKVDCVLINPKQKECNYPYKYLAGCGVAFKLAQALVLTTGLEKTVLNRTLDFLGIGTIGDIVPLLDENRTFAKYGLRAINLGERASLEGLISAIGLKKGTVSSENISFSIVPHLNAAGRMLSAGKALELLRAENCDDIETGVAQLLDFNSQRKYHQEKAYKICADIVTEKYMKDNFLVLDLQDAHEGITGIVAGKIKDTFMKPTLIVTHTGENLCKGTGRSIEGVNLYDLLKENEDLFIRFGGHSAACGFTIRKENLETLRQNLNRQMNLIAEKNPDIFAGKIKADLFLEPDDVNMELVEQLELLEPCGAENPQPLVGIKVFPKDLCKMGKEGQFRKFIGVMENGKTISCIIFNRASEYDDILQNDSIVSIIGSLGYNSWNGRRHLQLTVETVEV